VNKAAYFFLSSLLLINSPANAGLFSDEDARKQIKLLEARLSKLEAKLISTEEANKLSVEEANKHAISSMLDLQMQLEMHSDELRKVRGQNEEWVHNLQDVEKRQKDFYIDLDSRLRQVESSEAVSTSKPAATNLGDATKDVSAKPVGENRAFEAAYGLYKAESYQSAAIAFRDFMRQFPQSVHEANVYYWMGNAYFLAGDYANSQDSYQNLISRFPDHPRVAEALLNTAECQIELKFKTAAKNTLKQITSQFPGSDASEKAKKRLATLK
jgi:tol-pal system protein YbgF